MELRELPADRTHAKEECPPTYFLMLLNRIPDGNILFSEIVLSYSIFSEFNRCFRLGTIHYGSTSIKGSIRNLTFKAGRCK